MSQSVEIKVKYPKRSTRKPVFYTSQVQSKIQMIKETKPKRRYVHTSTFITKADLRKKLNITENDLIQTQHHVMELICKLEWYSENSSLSPPWKRGTKRKSDPLDEVSERPAKFVKE